MKRAFLDTDMIIALYDENDLLHEKALKVMEKNLDKNWEIYLSVNILMESLTIISQRISKKLSLEVLKQLRSGIYRIKLPNKETINLTFDIFERIKSKNVSFGDCLSFALMTNYNIKKVFSFDIHFKKQGFQRIGVD